MAELLVLLLFECDGFKAHEKSVGRSVLLELSRCAKADTDDRVSHVDYRLHCHHRLVQPML